MSDNHYRLPRGNSEDEASGSGLQHAGPSQQGHFYRSGGGNVGDVQHSATLAENIGRLYLNDECSDLTLIVEEQRFAVHRVILAARSTYFR
ncbi:BTB/POZ domain-containing protein 9, partial [Aphelenchoides avenae]